jgi:hypothetical protein
VLFPYCDAMMRGSPALRERIYPLILDVEPAVSAEMNISPRFNMLLDGFKGDAPYSYDEVQIDYKVLSAMCSGLAEGTGRASVAKKVRTLHFAARTTIGRMCIKRHTVMRVLVGPPTQITSTTSCRGKLRSYTSQTPSSLCSPAPMVSHVHCGSSWTPTTPWSARSDSLQRVVGMGSSH